MSNKKLEQQNVAKVFERWMRVNGWLFMAASIVLEDEGLQGKMAIRQWMRRWGMWRGRQARKGHQAVGYEINMINLMKHWDSAGAVTESLAKSWEAPECKWTPCHVLVNTPFTPQNCPQAALWREHDFWLDGHIHCDEFHTMYCRGYHPEAQVVLPECIMKNDPACTFSWIIPADHKPAPIAEPYEGENVLLDWAEGTPDEENFRALRRKSRSTAGRIYFLGEVLYEMFPEKADEYFGRIMDRWTTDRGKDLRAYLNKENIPATIEDLIENFDHPYIYLWDIETAKEDDKTMVKIGYCPFAETWGWLDKDKNASISEKIKKHYCSRCYHNVIENANYDLSAKLESCKLDGTSVCAFSIREK